MEKVQIIGAGLAGLSAAIELAKNGIYSNLISLQPSERAQSVLAEGGINAAINTMGENDNYRLHYEDTKKAGCNIADESAIMGLAKNAPEIIAMLDSIGVPFYKVNGIIQSRNFGGQKKKRTAFVKSSTGKSIMSALISEARKYEHEGLIKRYSRHEFIMLNLDTDNRAVGVKIIDIFTRKQVDLCGPVILAFGGMSGLFYQRTTGTTSNTSDALAQVYVQGMTLSNLEMIQYHPTTIGISGKRCLVSEAARGEGARLFINRNGKPWYFMEEKYPELGNLMPRDVIAREMFFCIEDKECDGQVYLDLRDIKKEVINKKLPDLCEEMKYYLGIDPRKKPIPVDPGIHYFMGGILVDINHRTNVERVYAAGECCSQYHGANRLGGNSLLGAIYGGLVAAKHIILNPEVLNIGLCDNKINSYKEEIDKNINPDIALKIAQILSDTLGIVRNQKTMSEGIEEIKKLRKSYSLNNWENNRTILAETILLSAIYRRESRGAHYRMDYPKLDENLTKVTIAKCKGEIELAYWEYK